jgi:hypothetical protein
MGHHQCTHILFDDICWRRSVQLIGQFLDSVADHRIDMGLGAAQRRSRRLGRNTWQQRAGLNRGKIRRSRSV